MSFITKRERVFNDYDLHDLPSRNEGKLKAFASCTDARAWSHFCTDKTEHLVDIIKRNNDKCAPKLIPTQVIVDTLLMSKKAEINRLKRKIDELQQMLAVYDDLDLDCGQKCEIAKAHADIKAANKDLEDLCLDLDEINSTYTEGVSEGFETGKSEGDISACYQPPSPKTESKSVQKSVTDACPCDVSTSATDPRIGDMQDEIINKDAKLNAMRNTIAAMESDVCEPYCVYAHIYTALEKIFGILNQNDKYKQYLDLLSAGKDTRCIDIKGKILFKMKVLEKFCLALIAPCSQETTESSHDCSCFRAEIVETTLALTTAEQERPTCLDNKRAQMVADIMESEEMKEILSKESVNKPDEIHTDDFLISDEYSVGAENLNRLKDLQASYDDLMACYENLKHERDCLKIRCQRYNELEMELEMLRNQLLNYNLLWNEKEHYRKRSEDLDELKDKYLVLRDETVNIENEYKNEKEINQRKSKTIEELRRESIDLHRKLTEASITFGKEKNDLELKLKEAEHTFERQEHRIKSLSIQLEQTPEKGSSDEPLSTSLLNEIETWKEQVVNLKELLLCSEDEKGHLQEQLQDKLSLINDLRIEIEDWKSTCDKTINRNKYLEKYAESFREEFVNLEEENKMLIANLEEKSEAVNNLMDVISSKSSEIDKLLDDIENKKSQNNELMEQLQQLRAAYSNKMASLDDEKNNIADMLQLERQHSDELLQKVKQFDDALHKKEDQTKSLEFKIKDFEVMNDTIDKLRNENARLRENVSSQENANAQLQHEIQRFREINSTAKEDFSSLKQVNDDLAHSLNIAKKDSETLLGKIYELQNVTDKLNNLQQSYTALLQENKHLKNALQEQNIALEKSIAALKLNQEENKQLFDKSQQNEVLKEEMASLNESYKKIVDEKYSLKKQLTDKSKDLENLMKALNDSKKENNNLLQGSIQIPKLEKKTSELEILYRELALQYKSLQNNISEKDNEISNLHSTLHEKENEIQNLREKQGLFEIKISSMLEYENEIKRTLDAKNSENEVLIKKINDYIALGDQLNALRDDYEKEKMKNNNLEKEFCAQESKIKQCKKDNQDLENKLKTCIDHTEYLEAILVKTREEQYDTTPNVDYEQLKMTIEHMGNEKMLSHSKIRKLMDTVDENENIISNLTHDLSARDDKIAVMQNHINSLEDEIRFLHENMERSLSTGEDVLDNSNHVIEQSLKTLDAHHSKATHNMKLMFNEAQKQNEQLQDKISQNEVKNNKERQKYDLELAQLQNDKESIMEVIKDLEKKCAGDSELSRKKCDAMAIIASLHRISEEWDKKLTKSSSLEHTLLKVQTSSQLLLVKADEAKKMSEKEKQKIVSEKEDALKNKLDLERQIKSLKEQLGKQIADDKNTIRDLEGEIQNQKLIIDTIKNSTQNYISNLEDEIKLLQESYQNALAKITKLEENLLNYKNENKNLSSLLLESKKNLEDKIKEITLLQELVEKSKSLPTKNTGTVQTEEKITSKSTFVQTDEISFEHKNVVEFKRKSNKKGAFPSANIYSEKDQDFLNSIAPHNPKQDAKVIQILTANVEPTFEVVNRDYYKYKIGQLSPGPLEQHSIASIDFENDNLQNSENETKTVGKAPKDTGVKDIKDTDQKKEQIKKDANVIHKTELLPELNQIGVQEMQTKTNYKDLSTKTRPSDRESEIKDVLMIYRDDNSNNSTSDQNKSETYFKTPANKSSNSLKYTSKEYIRQNKKDIPSNELNKKNKIRRKDYSPRKENDPIVNYTNNDFSSRTQNQQNTTQTSDFKRQFKPNISEWEVNEKVLKPTDTLSDNQLIDKLSVNKTNTSLPSLINSNDLVISQNSLDLASDEETIQRVLDKERKPPQSSDTDDEKLKQRETARRSFGLLSNFDDDLSSKNHGYHLKNDNIDSFHKLDRVDGDAHLLHNNKKYDSTYAKGPKTVSQDFGLEFIMESVKRENANSSDAYYAETVRQTKSDNSMQTNTHTDLSKGQQSATNVDSYPNAYSHGSKGMVKSKTPRREYESKSVLVKNDSTEYYENKIASLENALENIHKDYKKKLDAIKKQYDSNIKNMIQEHNTGVESIQNLHEDTLHDIVKIHENEVENLRTMSIEAMRKAEKLKIENKNLKHKITEHLSESTVVNLAQVRKSLIDSGGRTARSGESRTLTKTSVEAFNVKPKSRSIGPCTCSLDINISDTIRNIFEQVDTEQRKMAEYAYLKYIANKLTSGNVDSLDTQELSFLHFNVCRTWKNKLSKEEALKKKINSLETELMNKQRHTQKHIAELDRKVAEERRRLQEVREAVCHTGTTQASTRSGNPRNFKHPQAPIGEVATAAADNAYLSVGCHCSNGQPSCNAEWNSAGDLNGGAGIPHKKAKTDTNRAVSAKLGPADRRTAASTADKRVLNDELPTRLQRRDRGPIARAYRK